MSKMRIVKITTVIIAVVLLLIMGGVAAAWIYPTTDITSQNLTIYPHAFPWEGSEILPDGIEGENHSVLINNIINGVMTENGKEVGIGLNDPDSELNEQLASREKRNKYTFGSMDAWDSSQMNSLFGLDAAELAFMIYSPKDNDNLKYIYTASNDLGSSGWFSGNPNYPIGERIYPIYRTRVEYKLTESGNYEWVAVKTVIGSAQSKYYDNDYFGSGVVKNPAFDPLSFAPLNATDCESGETAIAMGADTTNAIYVYNGRTVILNVASNGTTTFFKYTAKSNGTAKIIVNDHIDSINAKVYSNSALSSEVSTIHDGNSYSFNVRSNTTYYISITGNQELNFMLSQ